MHFVMDTEGSTLPSDRRVEIVERKGLGHPDTICDALAEEFSLELSRFYLQETGRIRHHNVDKALLVAGLSAPRFGGGRVLEPMRIMLAGRAVLESEGVTIPIDELAERSATRWLARNLRGLDPDAPAVVSSLVRPGSDELVSLFADDGKERAPLANDTSCGVGYAPLSEVEALVLALEQGLNSDEARDREPAIGEDIKVMAIRRDDAIELTIACAMVDRYLPDLAAYAKAREGVSEFAHDVAVRTTACPVSIRVNAADDLDQGRIYMTVTGTSAEAGDDGQAGRGNRANGLITPGRAMTIESVAGKNPVTHVGKLYNLAASLAAERLVDSLDDVRGAECRLVSQIGQPIDEPSLAEIRLSVGDAGRDPGFRRDAEDIVRDELAHLPALADELLAGTLTLNQWPMRR